MIFCNHILEHVDDDRQAMGTFPRDASGRLGIMLSPVNPDRETTYEDPSITDPVQRELHFGQKITCAITAGITASAWPKPGSMSKRSTTSVSSVRKRRRCTGCVRK